MALVQTKREKAVGVPVTATVDGLAVDMSVYFGLVLGFAVIGLRVGAEVGAEGRLVEGLLEGVTVGVDGLRVEGRLDDGLEE
jgi:hypothetical protein